MQGEEVPLQAQGHEGPGGEARRVSGKSWFLYKMVNQKFL